MLTTSCTSTLMKDIDTNSFSYMKIKPDSEFSNVILAIHGYNDYSNSFKIPGEYLSKNNIALTSFDLNGFGKNKNKGEWFDLKQHIKDIDFNLKKIKNENPDKKIFLLGESMGGAITLSFVNRFRNLPIDGVILIAPAIWNFTETNFWKSIPLKFFAKILPYFKVSGKGIVKVQASDNVKMLKELSMDDLFIHKPTFRSLQGVVDLMDEAYKETEEYFKNPSYKTLIMIPLKDEIVPRKPLIKLLKDERIKNNFSDKIKILVYEESYHMILRDLNGDKITEDLKNWVIGKEYDSSNSSFSDILKQIENTEFYHRLDL